MSDFSVYTAGQIADWMSQGTIETAPSDLYVTVFDDTGTERASDFAAGGRVSTATGTDWSIVATGFENANEVSFGEATADVANLQDIALFDAATGGNEIARYNLSGAPFDVSSGTTLAFPAGNISFNVQDRTE
jgi:hypothetical protein